ncbi:allantoate permease [Phlyctema vagabunda]|uniref:Allantoate permease n=1 Tax=Phlyctema vagabunda TaxID=108571 RepID=A0ABR4P933_9HELO
MVGSALLSQKSGQTCLVMLAWTFPPIIGTGIILGIAPTSKNAGGLLIAFYCTQFFLAQGNMIISLISRNIAGQTKKGICISLTFVGWAVGNMIAPQIFQSGDAPRYKHGFTTHMVVYGVYFLLVLATRALLLAKNKRKEHRTLEMGQAAVSHDLAFDDLTDIENPNFRYVF